MGDEKRITPIQLYNTNAIRSFRLDLDVSATELSVGIKKGPTYIGHLESNAGDSYYSDDVMNRVADFLSKAAKEKQAYLKSQKSRKKIKTDYTVHDFYPKKQLPEAKVSRVIEPIPKGSGPTITLNAVLETSDFFDIPRRLSEIVAHCNQLQNQKWKGSDFTQTISRLVKKERLQEVPVEGGFTAYVKPEEAKKD